MYGFTQLGPFDSVQVEGKAVCPVRRRRVPVNRYVGPPVRRYAEAAGVGRISGGCEPRAFLHETHEAGVKLGIEGVGYSCSIGRGVGYRVRGGCRVRPYFDQVANPPVGAAGRPPRRLGEEDARGIWRGVGVSPDPRFKAEAGPAEVSITVVNAIGVGAVIRVGGIPPDRFRCRSRGGLLEARPQAKVVRPESIFQGVKNMDSGGGARRGGGGILGEAALVVGVEPKIVNVAAVEAESVSALSLD